MLYTDVMIESLAYELPEMRKSSADLEEQLKPLYNALSLSPGLLELMTGVKERRLWPSHLPPSHLAASVAGRALQQSGIATRDISLLIYTGVCRDFIEPATAHIIHHRLSLGRECLTFDLSNACVGFLNGMLIAANMIENGQVEKALIVSAESASPLYEKTIARLNDDPTERAYRSSLASLTLGSASAAVVLSKAKGAYPRLLGGISRTASEHHTLCQGSGDFRNPFMRTDSVNLMKEGLKLAKLAWQDFLGELKWGTSTPACILTHQVSQSHHAKFFETLELDPSRGQNDLPYLGNTGSVAAPLSLALSAEAGRLHAGDKIAMLGIGSGLTTLMLGLQWNYPHS
ncbi:MAG: 3-oxoacyl-ACP synthase III [Deltaproteobacteria bacterium]|nr:3-oxoacyl-ACP synthase III [Deltaproteobacteria bacterium]